MLSDERNVSQELLEKTLRVVAVELVHLSDPWWLIGSGAMAAHGLQSLDVGDADLLVSATDAQRLLSRWGLAPITDEPSSRFKSDVYGRCRSLPLPVEILGGFHIRQGKRWERVVVRDRLLRRWRGVEVFLPSINELVRLCTLFDRPQDRERAELLVDLSHNLSKEDEAPSQ